MRKIRISMLLITILLLFGCGKKETQPEVDGPQYWNETPKIEYGVWESEKMDVVPWYSARGEETSNYKLVETKLGYYLRYGPMVYYADKEDLANWVPVCDKPNCSHRETHKCNAHMGQRTLLMKDSRLIFDTNIGDLSVQSNGDTNGDVLVSVAPDGTDRRIEEEYSEFFISSGLISGYLSSREWVYFKSGLQPDGTLTKELLRVVDGNIQKYSEITGVDPFAPQQGHGMLWEEQWINGDRYYYHGDLNPEKGHYFRFDEDGKMQWINLKGVDAMFGYISGDVIRFFRSNDGYFDRNLITGEETKIAEPRMKNSFASIMLPNCVIESTLHNSSGPLAWEPVTEHALAVFDGTQWRDVALPTELQNATGVGLTVVSVNSDCIFMRYWNLELDGLTLYKIDLTSEKLSLEYCGAVSLEENYRS